MDELRAIHQHRGAMSLATLACLALSACGGGGSSNERDAQPVLTRITVSPSELTLDALDATAQLQATARDQNGATMTVQFGWGSSNASIVSVNVNGLVTAIDNGTATVTVSSGSVSASTAVTAEQRPASIALSQDEVLLTAAGADLQLEASVLDANGNAMSADLVWESSNPAVAAVDDNGKVTAQADGTATITATVRDQDPGVSDLAEITVRRSLTVSGDPNVRDPRTGRTPLHAAAMANAPRLIAALVAAGADIEARELDGFTPLHSAALANAPAAISALVEAGADIEARNRFDETPLLYAVLYEIAPEAVAALLAAGADPNARVEDDTTALHAAASTAAFARLRHEKSGAMATLRALLAAGADPNARDNGGYGLFCGRPLVKINPDGGRTPLHHAAPGINAEPLLALLAAGADPNARDVTGYTPVGWWAGESENPEKLAALLEAGAELEFRDQDGFSLLHLAAERDLPVNVKALLQAGADVSARDNAGRTALHVSAGSIELGVPVASAAAAIAVLLEAGADPDARDHSGSTVLQGAPEGSKALMSALLDAHAGRTVVQPNARDEYGYTAVRAAARANSPRLIATLLEAGADLDAHDERGYTALRRAAIGGETATMATLLEAGANPGTRDGDGRTALQVALEEWAFDEGDRAAIVALAEAEANLEGGGQKDFAAAVALAVGNPSALPGAGVDLNARDNEGRTVLHWVVGWDDAVAYPALTALVEAGADLNARDLVGRTAVYWAVWRRNPGMIAALAEAGADLNVLVRRRTALHQAIVWQYRDVVAALAAAGADAELSDENGWTALQLAAFEGQPAMIAALAAAGADLEARDHLGRTALQLAANRDHPGRWDGGPSTPAAVAALLEAGAEFNAVDNAGNTALHTSATGRNRAATGMLVALGANWTSGPVATDLNARIVTVELFQGPMVWQWQPVESAGTAAGSGMGEGNSVDHAKTLLHRATTVAVRIGSENPDPLPELAVSLSDADGRTWAVDADLVQDPHIVSVPSESESGLWETEYVYELPAQWVDSGNQATFSVDPLNRLKETGENDNTAILTMDGYAVPTFEVTFVPIVFSGEPDDIDTETYMAVIGDLLPIGDHRAHVGPLLDLSDRNLGTHDRALSRSTALRELLQRWNAEAAENEYYYGLLFTAEQGFVIGGVGLFGGIAYHEGNVAVSDALGGPCQWERIFCGDGVHAHELGHNLGLVHLPGSCSGPEPVDHAFPYADAGIGPRRGWVASRNEFVNPGDSRDYRDLMGYCTPRFVSDYNYNKMVDHRLADNQPPSEVSGRIGPSLEIGPEASSSSATPAPAVVYAPPAGAASATDDSHPGPALTGTLEETGPSLAFAGVVDEYGLWSIGQLDASTQPPRSPDTDGEVYFTLWDASQREIYREPMSLLRPVHGETRQAWAVRVPEPDGTPAFLAILDARGTPLFIETIEMPDDVPLAN